MSQSLSGTVALVTGASSGIGEATAVALAERGATVALVARRRDKLEALAERIGGSGKALVIEADVSDQAQAQAAVETAVGELGRLDTLVNNAGVMLLGPIVGAPLEEWQRMVTLNVLGLLYCTHAALPHLLAAAEGDRARWPTWSTSARRPAGWPASTAASTTPPSSAWSPSASPCARR